jgi:hypothetical protein
VRRCLIFLIIFLFFQSPTFPQRVIADLLPNEKSFYETGYTIKEVIDMRINKTKIGDVYDPSGRRQGIGFQGNLDQLVLQFFNKSIRPSQADVQQVQARIFELELKEKPSPNNTVFEGEIRLIIGFFKIGNLEPVQLIDYSGSVQYRRSPNRMDMVDNVVSRVFGGALEYFDTWMNMQIMANRNLATKVRLEIIDQVKKSHKDTVYYDAKRPLVWKDFADKPNPKSRFNATIFASFSIQGKSLIESGMIVQTIEIEVYMLPAQSWVRNPNDYALNHEQRHFDVVRIVADRLIHKLNKLELDPDWYEAVINDAYFDAYREMNRLQEIYDKHTRHGMDIIAQENWNRWIDEGLAGNWEMIENALNEKK